MTFVEVLQALARGEVGFEQLREDWREDWRPLPLDRHAYLTADGFVLMSRHRYRRKPAPAPRLSRVREMFDARADRELWTDGTGTVLPFVERVVNEISNWLSETEAGHMIDHDLPGKVRREFLGARK